MGKAVVTHVTSVRQSMGSDDGAGMHISDPDHAPAAAPAPKHRPRRARRHLSAPRYDFHPDVWGRGIATEAARAVMRQALGPLDMARVIAVVKLSHVASQRVLVKAGLHRAGTRLAYGERMLLYQSSRPDARLRAS